MSEVSKNYLKFSDGTKWLLWKPRIMAKFYNEKLMEIINKKETEETMKKRNRMSSGPKDLEKAEEEEKNRLEKLSEKENRGVLYIYGNIIR
jgi:hypothetical protein